MFNRRLLYLKYRYDIHKIIINQSPSLICDEFEKQFLNWKWRWIGAKSDYSRKLSKILSLTASYLHGYRKRYRAITWIPVECHSENWQRKSQRRKQQQLRGEQAHFLHTDKMLHIYLIDSPDTYKYKHKYFIAHI